MAKKANESAMVTLGKHLDAMTDDVTGGWFGVINGMCNWAHYQAQYKRTGIDQEMVTLENSLTGIHANSDTAKHSAAVAAGKIEILEDQLAQLDTFMAWATREYKRQNNREWLPPVKGGNKRTAPSADPQAVLDRIKALKDAATG